MKRYLIYILSCFASFFPSLLCSQETGEEENINQRRLQESSAILTVGDFVSGHSAAAAYYRRGYTFTQLEGRLERQDEEEAFEPALGDGSLQGAFRVDSYLRLDSRSVAYGGAEYVNGQKDNVCWNSTSDYGLLYPYVLADSVGGDLRSEQYRFYGGYARQDGRFNYGLLASYRALHEYRQVDPRPRNITGDLQADASAGYCLNRHVAGVAAGIRIYKQEQSVDFYDPSGANTSELQFTGLGTYYARYSGTNYTSVRYRGTGWHIAFTLVPCQGDGWFLLADYDHMKTERRLSDINMSPLTALTVQTLNGGVAYRHSARHVSWAVTAKGAYIFRQGTENVMGSGNSNGNQPLLGQNLYNNHGGRAEVAGIVEWKCPAGTWTFRPSADFYAENEEYVYPARRQEVMQAGGGMEVGYTRLRDAWLWETGVGAHYAANLDGTFDIPADDTDSRIYAYLSRLYERRTDNCTSLQARLRVQRQLKLNMAVSVSVGYAKLLYAEGLRDDRLQVGIGVCF